MIKQFNMTDKEKIPSYVPIYNQLYADIMNGVYLDGESLPGETALAKEYGVSRHTLRQALTILTEDGLIKKMQGKGSIITLKKKYFNPWQKELFNPMIEYAIDDVEIIDLNYNFAPPTEIASRKLNIESHEILIASNNVYKSKERTIGHSFMQIPMKQIESLKLDLNNKDEVSKLINEIIFKMAYRANASVKTILAEDHVTNFLEVPEKTSILYIEEVLYNEEQIPICRCKFYFIPDAYDINLWI